MHTSCWALKTYIYGKDCLIIKYTNKMKKQRLERYFNVLFTVVKINEIKKHPKVGGI